MANPRRVARPYKDAIYWLARNDDCDWLEDGVGALSVSAGLVADMYGRTDDEVKADLKRARR
jgi:hypothetical protein